MAGFNVSKRLSNGSPMKPAPPVTNALLMAEAPIWPLTSGSKYHEGRQPNSEWSTVKVVEDSEHSAPSLRL
jgi:hypothetical protein